MRSNLNTGKRDMGFWIADCSCGKKMHGMRENRKSKSSFPFLSNDSMTMGLSVAIEIFWILDEK